MKKAFSLVEILVVIVILAVLTSFLLPVLTRTKAKAKETSCISNLHQLYIAMQLYRSDEGDYPPGNDPNILNKTYLGGTKLRCWMQRNPWIVADYQLTGNPHYHPGDREFERIAPLFKSCQEKRGPDFPIVLDTNHRSQNAAIETGDAFFLIARESGQVKRIPYKGYTEIRNGPAPAPCARELGPLNL